MFGCLAAIIVNPGYGRRSAETGRLGPSSEDSRLSCADGTGAEHAVRVSQRGGLGYASTNAGYSRAKRWWVLARGRRVVDERWWQASVRVGRWIRSCPVLSLLVDAGGGGGGRRRHVFPPRIPGERRLCTALLGSVLGRIDFLGAHRIVVAQHYPGQEFHCAVAPGDEGESEWLPSLGDSLVLDQAHRQINTAAHHAKLIAQAGLHDGLLSSACRVPCSRIQAPQRESLWPAPRPAARGRCILAAYARLALIRLYALTTVLSTPRG